MIERLWLLNKRAFYVAQFKKKKTRGIKDFGNRGTRSPREREPKVFVRLIARPLSQNRVCISL